MNDPFAEFERSLDARQLGELRKLKSPERIQRFLDDIPYCHTDVYRSPLSVVKGERACCMEGALLAAVAFKKLGFPPRVLLMISEHDDDHVLAVFRRNGLWGAVAKSDFAGLRGRPPVYRTLRELVLSYFHAFYNKTARYSLRSYSLPLRLDKIRKIRWTVDDDAVNRISDAIDRQRVIALVPSRIARKLPRVDERTYRAGLVKSSHASLYRYFDKKKK
jgi:hypothetical protein